MKYLKILIVILVVVSVALVSYYLYLLLAPTKSNKTAGSDVERLFQPSTNKAGGTKMISEVVDFVSADVEPGKTVKIQGKFQSGDPVQNVINDVSYVYVVGVLTEDGSLAKVWLTQTEYEKIQDLLKWGTVFGGQSVRFTISRDLVTFEKFTP